MRLRKLFIKKNIFYIFDIQAFTKLTYFASVEGDKVDFKDKVKTRRLELGLTLEDVAKAVGVTAPTILRYESGNIKNVRKDKIKALADALQVSPSYLMDWENSDDFNSSFNYFMEMQMLLLGYKIIFDDEDGYIIIKGKEGEFEISESDIDSLSNDLESFLNFKIYELMKNSRKFGK